MENYQPLTILSHDSKLLEFIVYKNILPLVNLIIMNEQFGFHRYNHRLFYHLLSLHLDAFHHRSEVDSIFLNFSKTFDRVNHDALLNIVVDDFGFGNPL